MFNNSIKKIILLGVVISIGLSSCGVINKKYKAPEFDTAKLYRDMNSTDTTTIASICWRQYFKDPILQDYIEEGLNNNYDLKIVAARVKQAEAALSMAKGAMLPMVGVSGNVTHNRASNRNPLTNMPMPPKALGYDATTFALGLGVSWEVDLWGKLNSQKKASYAQYLNSQVGRNLVQTGLVSGIANMYYALMALDEQLRITKEAILLLENNVETMQSMMDAGLTNGAAVEQSKAVLFSTQLSIPEIESQIHQLENSLCTTLGRKASGIVRANISKQEIPQEFKVGIPLQMIARRPDVQQAELSFRSAFELTNAAHASFYPSLTLSQGSMIGYGSVELTDFFKPANLAANIIGGLTQPIFAQNKLTANLKNAKASQEASLLAFEKTVLTASQEVSDIMYGYKSSLSKNELRLKQLESSQKSVEYTQLLFKAAEASYFEVLNAQQNLLQAQRGQVSDKLEQLQYSVNLYRALGGGGN